MRNFEEIESFLGFRPHFGQDVVMRPHADAAEEAREHDFGTRELAGADSKQVVCDDTEKRPQSKDVPAVIPEDRHGSAFALQWIAFAGDGLDESRFAASVRPQDGDVLPDSDPKREVVKGDLLPPHDGNVMEIEQRGVQECLEYQEARG